MGLVAPARERGLKFKVISNTVTNSFVAPARERGLKFNLLQFKLLFCCRSREGAWIEIVLLKTACKLELCRSREGAWIEILKDLVNA